MTLRESLQVHVFLRRAHSIEVLIPHCDLKMFYIVFKTHSKPYLILIVWWLVTLTVA